MMHAVLALALSISAGATDPRSEVQQVRVDDFIRYVEHQEFPKDLAKIEVQFEGSLRLLRASLHGSGSFIVSVTACGNERSDAFSTVVAISRGYSVRFTGSAAPKDCSSYTFHGEGVTRRVMVKAFKGFLSKVYKVSNSTLLQVTRFYSEAS